MPNLKDIRRRIRSVKSTQKITQAMRMVAAAKVKRAENRVKAARPYTNELQRVFTSIYNALKNHTGALESSRYIELLKPKAVKRIGVVVVSSDRGLCGAYNSTIIRQALRLEKELVEKGFEPKFYLVGSKAVQAFKRYSNAPILGRIANMTAAPSVQDANVIAESLTNAFLADEIDAIEILSSQFVSMISYKLRMTPVIPVKGLVAEQVPTIEAAQAHVHEEARASTGSAQRVQAELTLEPDATETLNQVIPMYLSNIIYLQLLEAAASELAARMTAMSNATNNAADMINQLTIVYNKARQASITQEILEIVGGAEALS